jgi:hypothetical protein
MLRRSGHTQLTADWLVLLSRKRRAVATAMSRLPRTALACYRLELGPEALA